MSRSNAVHNLSSNPPYLSKAERVFDLVNLQRVKLEQSEVENVKKLLRWVHSPEDYSSLKIEISMDAEYFTVPQPK